MSPDQKHLIFYADPMCSWCWGFAPVVEKLRKAYGDSLPIRLVMGGLRVDQAGPMEDRIKAGVKTHWTHVQKTTGQPFDFSFFDRTDFVYDTEKPCRAVVAMRRLHPDDFNVPLDFMVTLHRAFYVDGLDITDPVVISVLAGQAGVDRQAFDGSFEDSKTKSENRMDMLVTQQSGISGFPSVLAGSEDAGFMIVTMGYSDFDTIGKPVADWFAGT